VDGCRGRMSDFDFDLLDGYRCSEKVNYQVGGRESTRRDGINSVSERERGT
jgi:phage FluMu protein gp41